MKKSAAKLTIVLLLTLGLMACGKSKGETVSFGTLGVNGPGVSGSIPINVPRLYTLGGIVSNPSTTVNYTVSTFIGSGDLTLSIYTSQAAFDNKELPLTTATVSGPTTTTANTYCEANFPVPIGGPGGNYAVVLSSMTGGLKNSQAFYELRLMSADSQYLSPISTVTPTTTGTIYSTSDTINPDYLKIYSSTTTTPISAGTYSISLVSTSTPTIFQNYPDMLIYGDATLNNQSLLISSVSTTIGFDIYTFTTPTIYTKTTSTSSDLISNVTFTTGSPYIVLKGNVATNYTFTISNP